MKNKIRDIGEIINKNSVAIEVIIGLVSILFLLYSMRSMLFFRETTLTHDNFLWKYPPFQFFADNIINGHFPLWNPFSHGGEPFYPIIAQTRLLEPITCLIIYFGKFISNDIVILFNWDHFIRSLMMVFGIYIVFRTISKYLIIKLSLMPILLYSSFILASFRQDFNLQFKWVPFITYFLLRIIYYKDYRWHNWILLGIFIGINWQSYFFTGAWIFLLFFILGFVFFHRELLIELFKTKMIILKFAVLFFILFIMAVPNIILMLEKDKYVFPARMIDSPYKGITPRGTPIQHESTTSAYISGIKMPYGFIAFTGTFSNIWNFIQIISPEGNAFVKWSGAKGWGNPSEVYMYIGLLPWFIAVLGLIVGRHDMKRLWLLLFFGFGLLMMGPPGGLHRLLYYIYPPMWFVRHTHTFAIFFIFASLYFYVLGFNHIFSTLGFTIFHQRIAQGALKCFIKNDNICKLIAVLLFFSCMILSVYWMTRLVYPYTNYLFSIIILIFVIGWLLRKDLGQGGLYISIILSHILIVYLFSNNRFEFSEYIFLVLGIPLASFIFIKIRKDISNRLFYYAQFIVLFIFSASLVFDLTYTFRKSAVLYKEAKHPKHIFNMETAPQKPSFPQNRRIYPYEFTVSGERGIRYLSLIYRQPFVFSSIMNGSAQFNSDTFEYALRSIRWSSFYLLKKYYELINMDIYPIALQEMFAVDKPVFQFKKGFMQIEENEIPDYLRQLGTRRSVELLQGYVLMNESLNQSLNKLRIFPGEYEITNQTVNNVNDKKEFNYSIEEYEYNSFRMVASANNDGILYWAEGYDRDWHAYINGEELPIYRANINFKAIYIPKGTSNINFVYNPVLFKIGLFIFYGTFTVCILAVLIVKSFYAIKESRRSY